MMSRPLFLIVALVAALPASAQTRVVSLKAADEVAAVSFSPHGDRIAAGIGKDRIAIWSLPDGKLLQDLKLPHAPISMLFAQADEIIVALADGVIEIRPLTTGTAVRRLDAGVPQPVLAVSTDGRLIASSGTEQIRLWDSSGKLLRTLSHEFGSMASLAFSPDWTLLASAGFDTNVHLWDVSTGQQKASLRDRLLTTFAMMFTADGKLFKNVENHISRSDEIPALVTLPAGSYTILLRSENRGYIRLPIVITAGRRTILDPDEAQTDLQKRFAQPRDPRRVAKTGTPRVQVSFANYSILRKLG